mmetsp:Transcript_110268/g.318698  ORF Transcript_110268/g.318698 Transcript_110268/m.318698 type:complete len:298 (+) Transcript_110268:134-1027(+)
MSAAANIWCTCLALKRRSSFWITDNNSLSVIHPSPLMSHFRKASWIFRMSSGCPPPLLSKPAASLIMPRPVTLKLPLIEAGLPTSEGAPMSLMRRANWGSGLRGCPDGSSMVPCNKRMNSLYRKYPEWSRSKNDNILAASSWVTWARVRSISWPVGMPAPSSAWRNSSRVTMPSSLRSTLLNIFCMLDRRSKRASRNCVTNCASCWPRWLTRCLSTNLRFSSSGAFCCCNCRRLSSRTCATGIQLLFPPPPWAPLCAPPPLAMVSPPSVEPGAPAPKSSRNFAAGNCLASAPSGSPI